MRTALDKYITIAEDEDDEPLLQVWWIPQVPGKPFVMPVTSLEEAARLIHTLAQYDLFQFEHNIKPDYSNAGGLMEWDKEEEEWLDWEDDMGDDINDWMDANQEMWMTNREFDHFCDEEDVDREAPPVAETKLLTCATCGCIGVHGAPCTIRMGVEREVREEEAV